MTEDRLNNSLQNIGYQRIDSNAQGIYLYYHATEQELKVVSVIHAITGSELSSEQYEHILEQINANFQTSYPMDRRLLSLILTAEPDKVKSLAVQAQQDSHWIIDLRTNRLIIYETQTDNFEDLRIMLEQILTEEQNARYEHQNSSEYDERGYYNAEARTKRADRFLSSPVTMALIAINILVYLMVNLFGVFGTRAQIFDKGALSWYYIREFKQYYRLVTSMFMHLNWSHLINNMIVLLFIGRNLERTVGKMKYLFIYFGTGIIAGTASISYNMWKEYADAALSVTTRSIGASGAIFGIVGAVLYIVVINKGRMREISSRQMILFVILSLYNGVVNSGIDQAAHVGGFIAGFIFTAILYRLPGRDTR